MKSMLTKAKKHGKKIIVHLKRHHRKYFYGFMCCAILTLIGIHTASTINDTFANGNEPKDLKILTADNFDEYCTVTDAEDDLVNISCIGTGIEGIAYGAFGKYSKKINLLDLSDNNISSLEFYYEYGENTDTIDVNDLILSQNKITEVKSVFETSHEIQLKVGSLHAFTLMEKPVTKTIWKSINVRSGGTIDLSYNEIDSIEKEAFSGLYLSKLDLSHNKISEIRKYTFAGLFVDGIVLGQNYIYYIEKETSIAGLSEIYLEDNCIPENIIGELPNMFGISQDRVHADGQKACFYLEFDPNSLTNGNVTGTLTTTGNVMGVEGYKNDLLFEETGTQYFDVNDIGEKSGLILNYPENNKFPATVTWIDKEIPTCNVRYSTTEPTNQNVTAKLTGCSESITCTNCNSGTKQHIFTGSDNFTFEFKDAAGNTGSTGASVTWLDKTKPDCSIKYSKTGRTNQPVRATLTGCNKTGISVTNNDGDKYHTFAQSGTFLFELADIFGNTGEVRATVTGIDTEKPTCNIRYEEQGETGNVSTIAKLVECSEEITVTNNSGYRDRVLGSGGEFTFQFKDRASNTGKATARIIVYVTITGNQQIINLYSGSRAITCNLTYSGDAEYGTAFMYIKTGMISQVSTLIYSGEEHKDYALAKSGMMYGWGASYDSGIGMSTEYNLNINEELRSFDGIDEDTTVICRKGIDDNSVFNLPNGITFYDINDYHFSYDEDVSFSINVEDTINAGESVDFTVKVMKDGSVYRDYTGTIIFALIDNNGDYVDSKYYSINNNGFYEFEKSDKGKKTFKRSLNIKKSGTYTLQVEGLNGGMGEEIITVKGTVNNNYYDDFEYDTLKFNPNYSDEMNEAYQFARYYDITTINTIKDAKMGSGLNRIAMAKMLANYAENVLGIDNFNTSRNCTFSDVSTSLDKQYDYGVTKACQLGIMGVNTPNHKFYPNGGVTRAEFATALSRLLYDTKDGTDKYYSTHISKLYREGIISNTDPKLREKRGYVMLMLMRASENYDY